MISTHDQNAATRLLCHIIIFVTVTVREYRALHVKVLCTKRYLISFNEIQ